MVGRKVGDAARKLKDKWTSSTVRRERTRSHRPPPPVGVGSCAEHRVERARAGARAISASLRERGVSSLESEPAAHDLSTSATARVRPSSKAELGIFEGLGSEERLDEHRHVNQVLLLGRLLGRLVAQFLVGRRGGLLRARTHTDERSRDARTSGREQAWRGAHTMLLRSSLFSRFCNK